MTAGKRRVIGREVEIEKENERLSILVFYFSLYIYNDERRSECLGEKNNIPSNKILSYSPFWYQKIDSNNKNILSKFKIFRKILKVETINLKAFKVKVINYN